MSQWQALPVTSSAATPPASASVGGLASPSEKIARPPTDASAASMSNASSISNSLAPPPKLRSCVVCRSRKVRCDKLSPCSNCRRANIACVFPSTDRPPRWARRRLERAANNNNNAASTAQAPQDFDPAAPQVMERLRNLESLIKDLRGQLEQAKTGTSSGVNSPEGSSHSHDRDTDHQHDTSLNTNPSSVHKQFGRLVLQDANRSRYVSSGFWSRINDELDGLKMDSQDFGAGDSDTSEDEASPGKSPSTQELDRTPSERHAFLFRHNLSPSIHDLREFHPLPSQIPFLLDVFSENVNTALPIVHLPTIAKMVRDMRGSDMTSLTPANEALMFSIYYAAVTSMEEDDILTNFGCTKTDLNLKYRLGLEHALAKADFLNVPDLVLVQAFAIFLALVRRHDSPRFVWMMTGLVIRMGQALGLHRDGTHFGHLTPYEIEMRRRVWWALCVLDVRAAEDQGTDYTIARGSFDTKLPLNINDADIEPETTQMPTAREGITDVTLPIVTYEMGDLSKQMMEQSAKDGAPDMEEQSRLLNEMYQKLDRGYLQYSVGSGNIKDWVGVIVARLVMAKMTLLVYLPVLFSSPNEKFSDSIKNKLLVAAIENAEYNHALNAEQACRQWRWVFQVYTHWYAIVYLLLEVSRRPWSPIVERAWVALHSQWLIPTQSHMSKNLRVWVPLRKLMTKARKHRDAEIERLRSDLQAAEQLEIEDQKIPIPGSPAHFPAGSKVVELFRERWRQLLVMPEGSGLSMGTSAQSGPGIISSSTHSTYTTQPLTSTTPTYNAGSLGSNATFEPAYLGTIGLQTSQNLSSNPSPIFQSVNLANAPGDFTMGEAVGPSYNASPAVSTGPTGPNFIHWLWADADPSIDVFANVDVDAINNVNMDLDSGVDWYSWVESAKVMEWDSGLSGTGQG